MISLNAQEPIETSVSSDDLLVNQSDVIAALEVLDIDIFKYQMGEFNEKHEVVFQLEEYSNDSLVNTTKLGEVDNWYTEFVDGNEGVVKFVSLLRVIAKKEANECQLSFDYSNSKFNRTFEFETTYNRQFFVWRRYAETRWKLNERIPFLAYVSSWKNKRGYIRCCGPHQLKDGDEKTTKFLSHSPSYFILSYRVTDAK